MLSKGVSVSTKNRRKSPAFSFYASNFLASTLTFSLRERGAYISLLAWSWENGSIPNEAKARCKILGCTAREERLVWETLQDKFTLEDGALKNPRLEAERAKQEEYREKSIAYGKQGGKKSTQLRKGGSTPPLSPHQPTSLSLSLNPEQIKEIWNATMTAPIPHVKMLTDKRRAKLRLRIEEVPDRETWKHLFAYLNTQDWCRACGTGSHGNWRATLDWIINSPTTLMKHIEAMQTPVPSRSIQAVKPNGNISQISSANRRFIGGTE